MKWNNIGLIVSREIRDQLRDRRTIFVIVVLPLLLYPLLGMSFLQVAQFLREHPTRIWVVGGERLPAEPALLDGDGFPAELFAAPADQRLLTVTAADEPPAGDIREIAEQAVSTGKYDAVVFISDAFAEQTRSLVNKAPRSDDPDAPTDEPAAVREGAAAGPEVFFDQSKDKSRVARDRVLAILTRWRSQFVAETLTRKSLPANAATPFLVVSRDLAAESNRRAALWSKILPFIIIIWAMTGAFYPAIDLCAGEKERGTLETLLSCPASRHEIVWGKLLTVMVFSMATSLLNLVSLGLTGRFVIAQIQALGGVGGLQLGPPPWETMIWIVLVLIPIAALFSALSLALAAMARSSKEGQYYLMPLMLGTMPLMMLPMLPAVELDLGNSLVPVTGVILLLRSLIEGQYLIALKFAAPVAAVTGVCCWLAVQWAIHQFQDESVLFDETERFDPRAWVVHLFRDRQATPTVAQALTCGVMLLLVRFVGTMFLSPATDWSGFVWQTFIVQAVLIAAPVVAMALVLTRSPAQTLLLRWPRWSHVGAAALLALAVHPVASALALGVHSLYPLNEQTLEQLRPLQTALGEASSMWQVLALLALLPAICEELAFRGFLLSGLRRIQNPLMAIVVSSLFFGIAHPVLQQSLTAFALGMVIGYVSIKTRSILPCMLFHGLHNGLQLSSSGWAVEPSRWLQGLVEIRDPGLVVYAWPVVVAGAALATAILYWLHLQDRPAVERPLLSGALQMSPVSPHE